MVGGGLRPGPWLLEQHPFPAQDSNSFSGAPLHPQFSRQVCTCCDGAQETPLSHCSHLTTLVGRADGNE